MLKNVANFLKNPVFWAAIAALATIIIALHPIVIRAHAETIPVFLCDEKKCPARDVVCVGPHGETVNPNAKGIAEIPKSWPQFSVRRSTNFAEVAVVPVPSAVDATLSVIITNEVPSVPH